MEFQCLFPVAEEVLRLSPQELGIGMLPLLVDLSAETGLDLDELKERIAGESLTAFPLATYPSQHRAGIRDAVTRAWQWLRREGLVIETPPGVGGFHFRLSELGVAIARAPDPIVAIKNEKVQLLSRPGPIIAELTGRADAFGFDTVQRDIARALLSAADDPEDAATAACSMIESVCRSILIELRLPLPDRKDIDGLVRAVQEALGLLPGQRGIPTEIEHDVRQLLGGLTSVAKGIGALRTHAGDAHGREAGFRRLDTRTSRLAINAAGSLALFLVETWQERTHKQGDPARRQ